MPDKEWSEMYEGYHMDAETVYKFKCPNCGEVSYYPLGQTVRYCFECKPPTKGGE